MNEIVESVRKKKRNEQREEKKKGKRNPIRMKIVSSALDCIDNEMFGSFSSSQ